MVQCIELDHVEKIKDAAFNVPNNNTNCHLPHHDIFRFNKLTTKQHVVFSASAIITSNLRLIYIQ